MVSKLFERNPLGSAPPQSASVRDPDVLHDNILDKLIIRFKTLLKFILNLSAENSCDKVLSHFKCLLDNDLKELRLDAIKFVQEDERLLLKKIKCRKVHRDFISDKVHPDLKSWPGICRARVQSQQCSSENKHFSQHSYCQSIIKGHMLSNDLAPQP